MQHNKTFSFAKYNGSPWVLVATSGSQHICLMRLQYENRNQLKHIDRYIFFFSQDAKQILGRYLAIELIFMLCGIMLLCHNAVSEYKATHRNSLVLEISVSLHKHHPAAISGITWPFTWSRAEWKQNAAAVSSYWCYIDTGRYEILMVW